MAREGEGEEAPPAVAAGEIAIPPEEAAGREEEPAAAAAAAAAMGETLNKKTGSNPPFLRVLSGRSHEAGESSILNLIRPSWRLRPGLCRQLAAFFLSTKPFLTSSQIILSET